MARVMPKFTALDFNSLSQSIRDNLAIIDEAKAAINQELGEGLAEGLKAVHSYKLDYEAGKRVFKVAVVQAAKAKVAAQPKGSLEDWRNAQLNGGRAV